MLKPVLKTIASQPSWVIRSSEVELFVTQLGGHMAPVTFYRGSARPVQPYYISPWQGEHLKIDDPVLVPLRGDFFCMPFGANRQYKGRKIELHGDTACCKWTFAGISSDHGRTSIALEMKAGPVIPGKATKLLHLVDGQNVVYSSDILEGFSLTTSLGHHATLAMPEKQESVQIVTSPFQFGMTYPVPAGDPTGGGYYCFDVGKRFAQLERVPTIDRRQPWADASRYPARKGFCDLVACFHKPGRSPAWTTAHFEDEGYLWFSLKDPAVLPTMMIWAENHGRHFSPWSGRNSCVGLEDVCGYFALGLEESVKPNALSRSGVKTAHTLRPSHPFEVHYIQGVVKTPRGFGKVKTLQFAPGEVRFVGAGGKTVAAPVQHEFLESGALL
jgi:hypothetical protein